jgi:hypothetical protein
MFFITWIIKYFAIQLHNVLKSLPIFTGPVFIMPAYGHQAVVTASWEQQTNNCDSDSRTALMKVDCSHWFQQEMDLNA